jgi:rod shape-determining protein MreB
VADAVSVGLPVLSPAGHMIVNIGADTTEIAVLSEGQVVIGRTMREGGMELDRDIATMVRRKFNISIGLKTAESLKNNLAFMINGPRIEQKVFGVHMLSGLPKSDMIPALAVSVSVLGTVDRIVEEIRSVVDRTPPMLQNLPVYIQKQLSLPVYHIQDPKNSTIRGIVTMINEKELHPLMRSPVW